jgi:endonuclease G
MKSKSDDIVIIDHKYFTVAYDQKLRHALYVVYELTADKLRKNVASRKNKFIADPYLVTKKIPFVKPAEYLNSGYDKGHLAPSADFAFSQEANDLTFVMSNMSPQKGNLNQDAWKRLENQVRKWGCGEEKVTVITGPVLGKQMATLKSGLIVPPSYFKIVIDETPPRKAIAFVYHQTDKGDVLQKNEISLEKLTSLLRNEVKPRIAAFTEKYGRLPASKEKWKEKDCGKAK